MNSPFEPISYPYVSQTPPTPPAQKQNALLCFPHSFSIHTHAKANCSSFQQEAENITNNKNTAVRIKIDSLPVSPIMMYLNRYAYDIVGVLIEALSRGNYGSIW